jgi:hypothetical protein
MRKGLTFAFRVFRMLCILALLAMFCHRFRVEYLLLGGPTEGVWCRAIGTESGNGPSYRVTLLDHDWTLRMAVDNRLVFRRGKRENSQATILKDIHQKPCLEIISNDWDSLHLRVLDPELAQYGKEISFRGRCY